MSERGEARRRAVEAAASWLAYEMSWSQNEAQYFVEGVLTAAERAMADAGWRMVRVPEKKDPATTLYISNEALAQDRNPSEVRRRMVADANWAAGNVEGWNACRAKMLEDEG